MAPSNLQQLESPPKRGPALDLPDERPFWPLAAADRFPAAFHPVIRLLRISFGRHPLTYRSANAISSGSAPG